MDKFQRAMIVVQEYNTLRNEILSLYTGLIQATVALIGILVALVTFGLVHDFTRTVRWLIGISPIFYLITQGLLFVTFSDCQLTFATSSNGLMTSLANLFSGGRQKRAWVVA
jgi:type IV secretory pathway VirB2 component (pilin)